MTDSSNAPLNKPLTPMMVQWAECKAKAQDAVLLFRLGDFYEAFEEDAVIMSKILEITLTKRHETPMAGIPFHAAENYIDTLVRHGYRVAIAEQTEEAKPGKGLVKREIVRLVTPGAALGVSDHKNNFFISFFEAGKLFGLAVIDLTTAEFRAAEFDKLDTLLSEVITLKPTEILTSQKVAKKHPEFIEELKRALNPRMAFEEEWRFESHLTQGILNQHFKTLSPDGFGLKGATASIGSAGALLAYLRDTLSQSVDHVRKIYTWASQDFLLIDRISQRNLELTECPWDGSRKNTLLEVIDNTKTPMGGRLIQSWLKQPLFSREKIVSRQEAIEEMRSMPLLDFQQNLSHVRDLERLVMKISSNLANPRDLVALKVSLEKIPALKSLIETKSSSLLQVLYDGLSPLTPLVQLLDISLTDEPPLRITNGGLFKKGYHHDLDELLELSSGSKDWLARYQTELKETTGIKTLKVGYTKISGFYIEVSRGQTEKVPDSFHRRQTLTNAERYLTPELKEYEEKILTAEDKITRLEQELFHDLKKKILPHIDEIYHNAHTLAHLDALASLATASLKWGWKRPFITEGNELMIQNGRHPVIEAKGSEPFVPNSTLMDAADTQMMIITGPNMAGKSTYIRQTALLVILAQMGSFVPAEKAQIGLIDKLFTRIGASDDLTRGQSTFMVEMTETANILNNATDRSLVILDEIGRGTSTYDGISIAWSVAEFLLTEENRQAKTLFATHFWELTKMEGKVPGAKNFTVAVHESDGEIKFLRKIIAGGTDKSYGIHVANLAGLPQSVIGRAKEILEHLEENAQRDRIFEPSKPKKFKKREANENQLVLF